MEKNLMELKHYLLKNATAKDTARKSLQFIYCDEQDVVACNDRVLVHFPVESFMPHMTTGLYKQVTSGTGRHKQTTYIRMDEDIQSIPYPRWRAVLPTFGSSARQCEFYVECAPHPALEVFRLQHFLMEVSNGVNFISDDHLALLAKTRVDKWKVTYQPHMTCLFEHWDVSLVVMPVSTLKEDELRRTFTGTNTNRED